MAQTFLPDAAQVLAEMAEAEQGLGWTAACAEQGRFVCTTAGLIESLADLFGRLGSGPVLEVASGDGLLAAALRGAGVEVVATDLAPPPGSGVAALAAQEALRRYRPATVLGCFVPAGSGVDGAVLSAPSVTHYVVINARLGGQCGDGALWSADGWRATPLPEVTEQLFTRHDVWVAPGRPILKHGESWLFSRRLPGSRRGRPGGFPREDPSP